MQVKPFKPPTAQATRAIIVLCVLVQLAATLGGQAFDEALVLRAGLIPARLIGDVTGLPGSVPAPLTLFSALFLHAGWLHLAMNLVFLAWVGRYVEWAMRPARLVLLYLLAGLAGGLAQVAAGPHTMVPVVGASGAIAGVFAAYAMLFGQSSATAEAAGSSRRATALTAARYAGLWIGLQLLTGLAFNHAGGTGIAIWAHIAGFVTGLLFVLPWMRQHGPDDEAVSRDA